MAGKRQGKIVNMRERSSVVARCALERHRQKGKRKRDEMAGTRVETEAWKGWGEMKRRWDASRGTHDMDMDVAWS